MAQRFAGQLTRMGDARKAQMHSSDTFELCEGAHLKHSSTGSASAAFAGRAAYSTAARSRGE